MKNTANMITMARIALIPVFMWAVFSSFPYSGVVALGIFIVASLSDGVDGYVARHYNQVTTFGKFIDPLADKLLVTSALFIFVEKGQMGSWAAMLIVAREFAVTSLRVVAMSEGTVVSAGISGKIKTFVQIICITIMLTSWAAVPVLSQSVTVGILAGWVMVAVTLWSGFVYFHEHRALFIQNVTPRTGQKDR